MSGRARTVSRMPAASSGQRGRGQPSGSGATREAGEPRTERILDLQRTAGNAAVAQMIGEEAARNLRAGSTGDDVRELQSTLNDRSDVGTPLEVDGIFGPITDRAVRELQSANPPLKVDGIVGPLTRGVLAAPGPADSEKLGRKVFERGVAAYQRRDFAHAYDFWVRAHELSPKPELLFDQGQALRRLGGRRDEAIACFEAYLATGGGTRHAQARELIAELRGPAATGVAEVDDAAARAAFERAAAMYTARDFAHAYDEFTKSWELSHRPELLFNRAQALRMLGGRDPEAISIYEQYVSSDGGSRKDEARQHIKDLRAPASTGVEAIDDAAARAIFEKAAVLYGKGDFAHAYDEFTRSWELSHRPELLFNRAQALRRLGGRRDEAITLYEQYIAAGTGGRLEEASQHIKELRTQGAEP